MVNLVIYLSVIYREKVNEILKFKVMVYLVEMVFLRIRFCVERCRIFLFLVLLEFDLGFVGVRKLL